MKLPIKNEPKRYNKNTSYGTSNFDDLNSAFDHNDVKGEENIESIVLEVPGENDELNWHWICKTKDGKFWYLEGGCDYTGWDCRSNLKSNGVFDTIEEAIESAPETPEYDDRNIKDIFIKQLNNELVFGTY